MTPAQDAELLQLLRSIAADVAAIRTAARAGRPAQQDDGPSAGSGHRRPDRGQADGEIADDRDLDGQYGDPTIKYDPSDKYWSGPTSVGYRFSETEPEYLDAMAKYLDACAYMAEKDSNEKKRRAAAYKRKDAARARGWAQRLRDGWAPPGNGSPPAARNWGDGGDIDHGADEIPF